MGGVDLMDRALSEFRPCIHGRKWYWQLLVNALNISVVFTWRLYLLIHSKCIPQKEFRMALFECITRSSATLAMSSLTRPGPSTNTLDRIRKDNIGHHPRKCVVYKKKCSLEYLQCVKCAKTLHINECFQVFHE